MVGNRLCAEVEARETMRLCSIDNGHVLGVLNVLNMAVMFVLGPWSCLGDHRVLPLKLWSWIFLCNG